MSVVSRIGLCVAENEIDSLGHVNNARFLEYLERGRTDWYNRCDPGLNDFTGHSLGTVVVRMEINYRRECFSGAQLSVLTRAHSRGQKSYVLQQEIYNSEDECVCDAMVTSVIMDMNARTTASLPESLAEQFA